MALCMRLTISVKYIVFCSSLFVLLNTNKCCQCFFLECNENANGMWGDDRHTVLSSFFCPEYYVKQINNYIILNQT